MKDLSLGIEASVYRSSPTQREQVSAFEIRDVVVGKDREIGRGASDERA